MVTCKDCVYFDVCSALNPEFKKYPKDYIDSDLCAKQCTTFKDRSRFVELPCKHGDTLFKINNGKIEKGVATAFFYGREFHIVDCKFPKISTGIPFHRFGKTVFLTREEAERALKEREKDE